MVLLGHLAGTRNAPEILGPFSHFGNIGVRFFFVISGFLITTLLLKELDGKGHASLRQFYCRRALRIFPASLFYIGIMYAAGAFGVVSLFEDDLMHALTYTMNYHHERSWYLNHLWSLSVEEQFYLLWPGVLCVAGVRRSKKGVLGTIICVPLMRALMWYSSGPNIPTAIMREFQAVADALATGCGLSLFYNQMNTARVQHWLQSWSFPILAAGLALLGNSLYVWNRGAFYVPGQTVCNVGIATLVLWCIRVPGKLVGRLLNSSPIVYIGVISYSLYLWQEPFLNPENLAWASSFPRNILFTVAASLFSYYIVERQFLKLKATLPRASRAIHS